MTTKTTVDMPQGLWRDFREAMLAQRDHREELLGLMFCSRQHLSDGTIRLFPRTWCVPDSACYSHRGIAGLELDQDVHRYLLEAHLRPGMDVLHVHTHPGDAMPEFSAVDDENERGYARSLRDCGVDSALLSGVFDEHMTKGRWRSWYSDRAATVAEDVEARIGWTGVERTSDAQETTVPETLLRQQVFGDRFRSTLAGLHVALVGCGGIGSVFVEQATRLGVHRWTLVDPDVVELSNLNRLPGATRAMAANRWSKVRYASHLVRRGAHVTPEIRQIRADLGGRRARVAKAVAEADLIVVATDNHASRIAAQRVASMYSRPLLSLGSDISVSADGGVRVLARATMVPPSPEWCLVCGGIVDPQEAAREQAPASVRATLAEAGYLPGVAAPGVFWVNSLAASFGAQILSGMVGGWIDQSQGLDWIIAGGQQQTLLGLQHAKSECYFCSAGGLAGGGG